MRVTDWRWVPATQAVGDATLGLVGVHVDHDAGVGERTAKGDLIVLVLDLIGRLARAQSLEVIHRPVVRSITADVSQLKWEPGGGQLTAALAHFWGWNQSICHGRATPSLHHQARIT